MTCYKLCLFGPILMTLTLVNVTGDSKTVPYLVGVGGGGVNSRLIKFELCMTGEQKGQ